MKAFEMNPFRLPMNKDLPPQDTPVGMRAKIRVTLPGYDQLPADEICDDVLLFPEKSAISKSQRLVVMVPRGNISENALARRVWQLASTSGLGVIYLALSPDEEQVPYFRRRLADLAMMTSNYNLRAYTHMSSESNWVSVIKKIIQPGDVLVCMANHMVSHHLVQREKLGEELVQMNSVPVYMLGGMKIGPTPEWEFAFKEVAAWITSLLLIIAFFGMQIGIDRSINGGFSKFLIVLSILAEFALLLKINDWIR
jgi:hypothetical protein